MYPLNLLVLWQWSSTQAVVCLPHEGQSPADDGGGFCLRSLRLIVANALEQCLQVFLRPAPTVLNSGKSLRSLISPHSLHCLACPDL